MSDIKAGDVIGGRWIVGEPIGLAPDPDVPCDADAATVGPGGQCRCTVCPRCRHHTGNSHQGHYWGYCKVTRTVREPHFCCKSEPGCELEVPA